MPTNIVYYEELSELYFQQGRDVEAFELWKRFIQNARDPVRALESMARRFERRGHDEWMLSLLERMAEKAVSSTAAAVNSAAEAVDTAVTEAADKV